MAADCEDFSICVLPHPTGAASNGLTLLRLKDQIARTATNSALRPWGKKCETPVGVGICVRPMGAWMNRCQTLMMRMAWVLLFAVAWPLGCSSPLVQNRPLKVLTISKKKPDTQTKVFRADLAVMPFAEFQGDQITLRYVRDCRYRSETDYDVRYYDLNFRLEDVRTVDFLIVPFKETDLLAHTMFSFGLADGRQFIISVEARLGPDETYTAVSGAGRKYPLMYVIGDERDLILLRTAVRNVEVFLYRGRATPEQTQNLLVDMLTRTNKLYREPEFYDSLTNNCTTNLVKHINKMYPGKVPADWRVLLPGHSDRLAYELGLLELNGPFEMARQNAKINELAQMYADSPEFSKRIRRQ